MTVQDDPNESDNLAGQARMREIEMTLKNQILEHISHTQI